MKKIFMLLIIVLVSNVLINSCIYDKVCEGESSIITPPDTTIVNPNTTNSRDFFIRFIHNTINGAGSFHFIWEESETVGFYISSKGTSILPNKEYIISSNTDGVGTANVTLYDSIKTSENDGIGFGYFPYQRTNISGSILSNYISNVQNQNIATAALDDNVLKNMLMVASPYSFSLNNSSTCALYFDCVFSFLRFNISNNQTVLPQIRTVDNVKIYIADINDLETPLSSVPLAGIYSIDLSSAGAVPQFSIPEYIINAKVDNSPTFQLKPTIWFVVNPMKLRYNERLVAEIKTNRDDYIRVPFSVPEINRNTLYDFDVVASETNTYIESTNEQYVNTISNCYIISQKGKYQIPAKRISGVALSGSTIDWLWATKEGAESSFDINDLIDSTSLVFDGSNIIFRVGKKDFSSKFTKGNVILALKDASGNIVWTWHIWLTDKPEEIAYDSFVFMDRNIGALSTDINNSPAVDTYGFVYQWGRKDPFFGGDGVIYDEATSILETARMHTIVNASTWNYVEKAIGGDLDYSIKHPMSFIYNKGSESSWKKDPADWLSTNNSSLWSATSKTDYDPCPDGYRVPAANEVNILHFANVTTPKAFDKDSEKYWKFDNSSSVSYWPAAGMRQGRQNLSSDNLYGAQLKYSGTNMLEGQCYYWTSTPFSVGGTPLLGASYRIHTVSNLLYSADDYGDNADAYPIRCVKE